MSGELVCKALRELQARETFVRCLVETYQHPRGIISLRLSLLYSEPTGVRKRGITRRLKGTVPRTWGRANRRTASEVGLRGFPVSLPTTLWSARLWKGSYQWACLMTAPSTAARNEAMHQQLVDTNSLFWFPSRASLFVWGVTKEPARLHESQAGWRRTHTADTAEEGETPESNSVGLLFPNSPST